MATKRRNAEVTCSLCSELTSHPSKDGRGQWVCQKCRKAMNSKPQSKRARKRNGEEAAAAALTEAFHGRPVRKVRDVAELYHERLELADLGRLLELRVLVDDDYERTLQFSGNVRLCASGDGGQLYFVAGDQALDLPKLGLAKYLPKDHVTVGPAAAIAYHTSKAFHDFEPTDYEHEFGEDGGELPVLCYDVQSQKLYLTGGSYRVRPEGIVN